MGVRSGIDEVVAELEPGGRLLGAYELTGGVSANVVRLEIATASGDRRQVVFRQHRSADFKQRGQQVTVTEFRVLAALHRAGLAVPEPYLCNDAGAVTAPYLVIEWVEGSTALVGDELPGALEQSAEFLVRLHSLDPSSLQLGDLDTIEDPVAGVVAYLPATEAGHHARAMLASGALGRVVNRHVLLHGDYWPGNVIWRTGRLAAVIDWEDARLGDPLADLATARVELLCRYGEEAMTAFTNRYLALHGASIGSSWVDSLALWELYVSAAALATMGDWGLPPAEEAQRRQCTELFFERAVQQLG